jgi:hypothetical protein
MNTGKQPNLPAGFYQVRITDAAQQITGLHLSG